MGIELKKRENIASVQKKQKGKIVVAGWVAEKRDLGGIKFLMLRDATGFLQITLLKKETPKKIFGDAFEDLTKESVIAVKGEIKKNPKAPSGVEVLPEEINVIARSEQPVPIDFSGKIKTSLDKRLDWRFIDLRNPKTLAIFKLESNIIDYFCYAFKKMGFTRIFASRIVSVATEGGAEVFPINYFNRRAYLAQSPQFYKELMLASGLEKVYDIGFAYRAEPHRTTRHICEYVSIDFEIGFIESMEDIMKEEEKLLKLVLEKLKKDKKTFELFGVEMPKTRTPFPRVALKEALIIVRKMGITPEPGDLTPQGEVALGDWAKKEHKQRFVFLTDFFWQDKPFYVMKKGKDLSNSFDLLMDGLEITTGGQREHDYEQRIKNCKEKRLVPKDFDHLRFFKYGVPPHGGLAIGLERFTQKLLGLKNIREATLLPRDPTRTTP